MTPADQLILAVTALLIALTLAWRPRLRPAILRLANRPVWCMALLAALPVLLRLALLPNFPVPAPTVSDDFSYLLIADTLRHFRFANPTHPLHQFFETFFVLQQPTYSSIFPLGQGIVLAIGALLGHPWMGVLLSIGAVSALCYWMLRGWTTPGWALAGGVLAAIEFGPLNQWTNSYWGGAVSAVAGCLVFGSLPRLGERRMAYVLAAGLSLQLLTRPFEFVLLVLAVTLFLTRHRRQAVLTGLLLLPAVALTAAHNKSVTGSWTTLPYQVSRYQYGVPATFTFQPNPAPHRELTTEQQLDYEAQCAVHGTGTDTVAAYAARLIRRIHFYRYFFLPPLYLALPFYLPALRDPRHRKAAITLGIFALGTNFYPYFYSHYIAALTCLFVLVSITALERLSRLSRPAAALLLTACVAHFLFWYSLHLLANQPFSATLRNYETSDAINHGDPEGRIAVDRRLASAPGKQLVFVRYGPAHTFSEWVHNAADIDDAIIVWARDLGPEENSKLRRYYPDRTAWLLEPDAHPIRLSPYPSN